MHICSVDLGGEAPVQSVCGAHNVAAGQKVIVATLGTTLYDGDQEFTIKKSKLRGVESLGMICAEDEIGVGTSHDGIIVLPEDAQVGMPAAEYYHLESDWVIEIDITANRADALSHYGVARDLYAWLVQNGYQTSLHRPDCDKFVVDNHDLNIDVEIQNTEACKRYACISITDCEVKESPEWLQNKLNIIGVRPINNIVDITNYVMMAYGQPMHCFDADMVKGNKIVVRTQPEGTHFTTLDGEDHELGLHDLSICNAEEPMCIAGIFGGKGSGTYETTRNVVLESAYFHPTWIRKSARRHGLSTDASFRFERGIDPNGLIYALKQAAILCKELAGGKISMEIKDEYPTLVPDADVRLDYAYVDTLIGKHIGNDTIKNIVSSLEMKIVAEDENGLNLVVPAYRVDVQRPCDVVEDILRIYGYNNVEIPLQLKSSLTIPSEQDKIHKLENIIGEQLVGCGFNEILNNSLTKSAYYSGLTTFPEERCVKIVNPLSSDLNVMRQTLILNGLEVIAYNANRQITSLRTFEYGSVYQRLPDTDGTTLASYEEHQCFALFVSGPTAKSWRLGEQKGNYFQLKGYVEQLCSRYGIDLLSMETEAAPSDVFAEGIVYRLPGTHEVFATLGTVSPALARKFDVRQPVFAAEIVWPVLLKLISRVKVKFQEMPKFPEVRRDLALLIDESVSYADLSRAAQKAVKKILKQVTLFDVYRGDKIPEGKKQYALNFVLQDPDKTLTDNEVEKAMDRLLATYQNTFGATLR